MPKLSDEQLEILRSCCCHSWYVDELNLVPVAEMVKFGLIRAYDDSDVIGLRATDKGRAYASRMKIARQDENGVWQHGEWRPNPVRKIP